MTGNKSGVALRPCGKVLDFYRDGVKVGELDWSMGRFEFFGDMGDSADMFFKVLQMWSCELPKETIQESVETFFDHLED